MAESTGTPVRAAPAVRTAAKQLGVDLATVKGSGKNGAITVLDVKSAAGPQGNQSTPPAQAAPPEAKIGPGTASAAVEKAAKALVDASAKVAAEQARQAAAIASRPEPEKGYYIVNPRGVIHCVDRTNATSQLKRVGYRLATKAEVGAYKAANGKQEVGKPLAKPYNPEPPALPDLDQEQ